MDWSLYPNFREDEFKCSHTGKNKMLPEFMEALQAIRTAAGFPFIISSGFRDPTHPIEAHKPGGPGEHTYGAAADIKIYGTRAMDLIIIAHGHGIRRIGVSQDGPVGSRYLHLGIGDRKLNFPQTIWSY